MSRSPSALLVIGLLAATTSAQGSAFLTTFSTMEANTSGSGGTVLATLQPNEISYLDLTVPCATLSAEKWLPRTCSHVMAGDEDANGTYFNAGIFDQINAVLAIRSSWSSTTIENQRTVFWSPAAPMGTAISGTPFRPGDVARIVNGPDGTVEYFMRQEQFNTALGVPTTTAIDVDAIAFQPNYGIFFSLASDLFAVTACGPMMVRDGDVICIPGGQFGVSSSLSIAGVAPSSAIVAYSEAQMDAFTTNAQVTNRFGACLSTVIDTTALEIDLLGPATSVSPCPGVVIPIPALIYACEAGTGASVLTTASGGQIYNSPCGAVGTGCGSGPTMGPQWGIRPVSTTTGAASYVNGISKARSCVHVLEPQQHVMSVFPLGAPAGANMIDYNNPFILDFILISLVSPTVPASVTVTPGFSPTCFPELYATPVVGWTTVGPGWGSFPMPAIPPMWTGKVLFQGVGFAPTGFELSTPTVIDVQ